MQQAVGVARECLQRFVEAERLAYLASPGELAQAGGHHRADEEITRDGRGRQIHVCAAECEKHGTENRDECALGEPRPTDPLKIVPAAIEPFDRLPCANSANLDLKGLGLTDTDRRSHGRLLTARAAVHAWDRDRECTPEFGPWGWWSRQPRRYTSEPVAPP